MAQVVNCPRCLDTGYTVDEAWPGPAGTVIVDPAGMDFCSCLAGVAAWEDFVDYQTGDRYTAPEEGGPDEGTGPGHPGA